MLIPSKNDLSKALSEAGPVHHDYETIILKGIRDENWSGFYAAYALGRLGNFISSSKFSQWLEDVPTTENWAESAAELVLLRLEK